MLDTLVEKINKHGGIQYVEMKNDEGVICNRHTRIPQIIVTLEEYFERLPDPFNKEIGLRVFAANAVHFTDAEFYELFKSFRGKETVQGVWIELVHYDPREEEYPYSDICYISTIAEEDEIKEWFGNKSCPSDITICEDAEFEELHLMGLPPIKDGYTLYYCWWD